MNTIAERLAAAFDHSEVKLKPQVVQGRRALAISYVNSRAIMDRLDAVLGICGWEDSYDVLPDGSVVCHLRLKIDGEWIAKTDVGTRPNSPTAATG